MFHFTIYDANREAKMEHQTAYFSYSAISCGTLAHPELHPMTSVSQYTFFSFDLFPYEKLMSGHETLSGLVF